MTASHESVSETGPRDTTGGENILVCGVNWLGDAVMSMPSVQVLKRKNPSSRLTMLVKKGLIPLWRMHNCVDALMELREGLGGMMGTVGNVGAGRFVRAWIMPLSFRSALVPFLAGVPERVGLPGHARDWMLTSVVNPRLGPGREHQAYEYLDLMGRGGDELEAPAVAVPKDLVEQCLGRLTGIKADHFVGLLPGAARGPAKRWPAEHFAAAGRMLVEAGKCGVLVFGTAEERDLCGSVADAVGKEALNLGGGTSLAEFAAMLSLCRVVIANDSGGAHLAAAVGAKVVAIFGATDPARTAPIGTSHRVIFDEGVSRSRDIARKSAEAEERLKSISPGRVCEAALALTESLSHGAP